MIKSVARNFSVFIFLLGISYVPSVVFSMNYNETLTLDKGGNGSIQVLYVEKESAIKQKNFLIGNLPFTNDKVSEYFSSPSVRIFSSKVENRANDNSLVQVLVSLTFQKITDLNSLKAFTKSNFSLIQTDTGLVLKRTFSPEFVNENSIDQILFVAKSDLGILSSNGQIKDNVASFFRPKDFLDGKNEVNFVSTFNQGVKKSSGEDKKVEKDPKSCGLFGFELPLILLAGYVFGLKKRWN